MISIGLQAGAMSPYSIKSIVAPQRSVLDDPADRAMAAMKNHGMDVPDSVSLSGGSGRQESSQEKAETSESEIESQAEPTEVHKANNGHKTAKRKKSPKAHGSEDRMREVYA